MLYVILSIILFLLLCSAFFSASETALTAITKPQIYQLTEKGGKRARMLKDVSQNMSRVLGTVLLGNNLVNILATSLATHLFVKYFNETGIGLATLCMTFLILIFSELMPKLYALYNPTGVSLWGAPLMRYCIRMFFPFTRIVRNTAETLWSLLGVSLHSNKGASSHEELRGAIDIFTNKKGDQKEMLHSILDLSVVSVEEVMIHRKGVEMINKGKPLEAIREQVLESPHARLPVWENSPDNIVGILQTKMLLKKLQKSKKVTLDSLCHAPAFSPESTSLADQVEIFRQTQQHMSIVIDEYGSVQGIVTLQDILEEILGKMSDENDRRAKDIQGNPFDGYIIKGTTTLRDMRRMLGWKIAHKSAATLSGFLLYEARSIPQKGQTYHFQNLLFEILNCSEKHIEQVRVKKASLNGH